MENVYNLLGKVSIARRGFFLTSIDSEGSILLAHDSGFFAPVISLLAFTPCLMSALGCVGGHCWSPGQQF